MPNGGTYDQYPNIGEYGWHRIGIQTHQDAFIEDGEVVYKATTTLYIDGVKVSSYHFNLNKVADDRLFSAEIVDGELVYSDLKDSIYVVAYRIANGRCANDLGYFVVGDVSVTCGTDFVMNVAPLTTPTEGTFTPADGVELDADVYFEVVTETDDAEDVVTPNPGDSEDAEDAEDVVTPNPGDSEDAENAGNGGASEDAENAGNGGASDFEDSENAGTTTPLIPGLGTATGN